MTRHHWTKKLILALLMGLASAAPAQAPDPDVADVFVVGPDGEFRATYNVGGQSWTHRANPAGGQVLILSEDEAELGSIDVAPGDAVLVNEGPNGTPISDPGLAFSLVSLTGALSNPDAPTTPAVVISARTARGPAPLDGTPLNELVQVSLRARPGPALAGETAGMELSWSVNGAMARTRAGDTAEFYLATSGSFEIAAIAQQRGVRSAERRARFEIQIGDPLVDTDGDGVPDLAEAELGMDPFGRDDVVFQDADDDGVPDLLERLCGPLGSDPDDRDSVPPDSDGDGAIDCQEDWRGTDPHDTQLLAPDRPVARTPFGVEHLYSGQVWADMEELVPLPSVGDFRTHRVGGADFELTPEDLPDAAQLAQSGVSESELPERLRPAVVDAARSAGQVPPLRVSAHSPVVLRIEADGDPRRVSRAWVGAVPDLTPALVSEALVETGTPWTTGAGWVAAYVDYLRAHLVQPRPVPVSPRTSLSMTLLDQALEAETGQGLLGEAPSEPAATAVRYLVGVLREQLGPDVNDPLSVLHGELDALAAGAAGDAVGPFRQTVAELYAALDFAEPNTVRASHARLQGDVAAHLAHLAVDTTGILPVADWAADPDPASSDLDGDGLSDADELAGRFGARSHVLLADTDGDGVDDGADPCPRESDDACLLVGYQEMDSDADGVIDALDNCLEVANPDQADADGNGQGDACAGPARIVRPASHRRVLAGTEIIFESALTRLTSLGRPAYRWSFDGAAPDSWLASPGAVRFDVPGNYQVTLTTTLDGQIHTESRTIAVQGFGLPPSVDAGGPYTCVEGDPLVLDASAFSPNGAIESIVWSLDDGTGGSFSANPTCVDRTVTARVTATDAINRQAHDTATVTGTDSAPRVAFDARPATGRAPLDVDLVDRTEAYDGVAARSWDLGDGNHVAQLASVQHRYTERGAYDVRLSVVDGDGSPGEAVRRIGVWSGLNPLPDSDGDGMPDPFEKRHGLDPSRDDAREDTDGDGHDNGTEYRVASDLNDAASVPPGPASAPHVLLRDDFEDGHLDDRWSIGIESPLAIHTVEERDGALRVRLARPVGEPCSELSLIQAALSSDPDGVGRVRVQLPGLPESGEICAAIFADDDGERVSVCVLRDALHARAEMRRTSSGQTLVLGEIEVDISQPFNPFEFRISKSSTWEAYFDGRFIAADDLTQEQSHARMLLTGRLCAPATVDLTFAIEQAEWLRDSDGDGVPDLEAGDRDGDGVADAADVCPDWPDPDQEDSDANGIGNACECGDQTGDGTVDIRDVLEMNAVIFGVKPASPLCDGNDDGRCDIQDVLAANGVIFGKPAFCPRNPSP